MRLAWQFALASDKITVDGVEVTLYEELVQRYRISSVPKAVVGESLEFVGARGEEALLEQVQKAAGTGGASSLIV